MLLLFHESPEENIAYVINDTTASLTLKEIERKKKNICTYDLYIRMLLIICIGKNEGWAWQECDAVYKINGKTGVY